MKIHVWIRFPNLQLLHLPIRYTTTHLPGKYTPTAIIEAYHLETISHHSAPNWTVCLLHFHFPLSALSASLWDRPEKWHSLRLIEHPRAQTKLTELHTGATHDCFDSLLLLCLLVKERRGTEGGTGRGSAGTVLGRLFLHWFSKTILLHKVLVNLRLQIKK